MFAGSIASFTVLGSLKALREGTPPERLAGVAGDDLMQRVSRSQDYVRWVRDWL